MRSMSLRWPACIAALFSLEYAVGKTIMAARGELGVPFHPAPVVRGLRRQHRCRAAGQRGPRPALAARRARVRDAAGAAGSRARCWRSGAGVALLSGLAGALVVATSLTGLREDHGQWGIDSLVLGVAPLGAWFLLRAARATRATARRRVARAAAPTPRSPRRRASRLAPRRAHTARGFSPRPRRPLRRRRPGRRAALAAAAACVAYGGLKLHWALGGEFLLRQSPLPPDALRDMLERDAASVASHWATVALAVVGVALACAARAARGWLLVGLPALLCALMLARAGYGIASDLLADDHNYPAAWDLALWSPFFAAWGLAWGLAALARSRAPR